MAESNWSEQAAEMMQSWMDAQHSMWQAWMDLASSPAKGSTSFADIAEEWQKLTMQSVQAWGAASDPIARSTAEQYIAAQGMALRFLDFSARAWETAVPKIKSGDDFQKAMEDVLAKFRQQWIELPSDAAAVSRDIEALWKLYLDQWRAFGQPWENLWTRSPGLWSRAVTGDSAALFEYADVYQTAYKQTLGRLAASPNLGMTREFNAHLLEGFDAFTVLSVAGAEYQAVVTETWEAAFKQFTADLAELAERGEKIESVRELVTLWTRGAENIFLEAFRTERYTLAQGKFLNANMEYRISQRRIMEEFLEAFDMPTRSEVDEAHRRIYELRKEVKSLKKQLNRMQATGESAARPAPAARKRTSSPRKKKKEA